VRLSHADFRPGKRPRYVPSGSPRRKLPLIRIALLLGLGFLVYTGFDEYWPRLRDSVQPAALWARAFGSGAPAATLAAAWSGDSSRITLECPRGLTGACCEALRPAGPDLCGEAAALMTKARRKGAIRVGARQEGTLQLEARAVVSDLGDWGFQLSGLRGRDGAGVFLFRRAAGAAAWCDAARGCLREPAPRAPLAGGLLREEPGAGPRWTAPGAQVRAVLPGRVAAVTKARDGMRVRVYHGRELYTDYGPLTPAAGVKSGALVKAGSHLGNAPGAGGEGHTLTVRVRQAGLNVDPAAFWNVNGNAGARAEAGTPLHAGTP
jgi:hypothetical protein